MKWFGGGLSHSEIWELPISVRKFYIKMMLEDVKRQNEANADAQRNTKKTPKMPKMPSFRNIRK